MCVRAYHKHFIKPFRQTLTELKWAHLCFRFPSSDRINWTIFVALCTTRAHTLKYLFRFPYYNIHHLSSLIAPMLTFISFNWHLVAPAGSLEGIAFRSLLISHSSVEYSDLNALHFKQYPLHWMDATFVFAHTDEEFHRARSCNNSFIPAESNRSASFGFATAATVKSNYFVVYESEQKERTINFGWSFRVLFCMCASNNDDRALICAGSWEFRSHRAY